MRGGRGESIARGGAHLAAPGPLRHSPPLPSACVPTSSLCTAAAAPFVCLRLALRIGRSAMGLLAKNPPAGKVNGGLRNVDELLAEKARAAPPRCATWQRRSGRTAWRAIWAPRRAVLRRRARDTHAPAGPRGARQAVQRVGISAASGAQPLGCTRNWRRPAWSTRQCTRLQRSGRPQRCPAPHPARRTACIGTSPRMQR